ncbi:phosphomethylpyrimidine synthase ThiC [Clostridium cibarium]|uniref:Phosphomethylpyrimidine synthase ThiC n=1 Tax=Clostridium cibarium TaxID=2762247 RepID=A0ABR8PY23_9CLOT|nr:phosphomethylpyrimidine synthase ThiC [Clostridium cibarium]MBD7913066.1 phosphomethylpyrimidine synthase ThiC [Clostridium cibarium]
MDRIGDLQLGNGVTRLVTHVGVTYEKSSPEEELKKAITAVDAGTDIIADASIGVNAKRNLKLLCDNLNVPVTALPGYIICTNTGLNEMPNNISKNEILETTEEILSYGAKSITIHAPIRKRHIELLENSQRSFPFTSRMGNYIRKYIKSTGKDNPFYIYFPEIVGLAKKYDAAISIGLSMRSPSITNDGGFDKLYKTEIADAADLVDICHKSGVTVAIENGGHIALNRLEEWFNYTKNVCKNAPLRVLSVATDRGMGHDNITGAITAAFMAKLGVEMICTITRAEHISQPTIEDIYESVINTRIALSIVNPDWVMEEKVAEARAKGGCHLPNVIRNVIDPKGAALELERRTGKGLVELEDVSSECTMCGLSCPLK